MNEHDPDPDYIEKLEWQLQTSLRRKERFGRPTAGRGIRMARTAALMIVCLAGGACGVLAAEHIQQSRETELWLMKNSVQLETATQLVDLEQKRLKIAEARWEEGIASSGSLEEARLASSAAEFELSTLELAETEIKATGRAPDRSLTAALAGSRDFVVEGLRLELEAARTRHEIHKLALKRAEALHADGRQTYLDVLKVRQVSLGYEQDIKLIEERLELRAGFLDGRWEARTTDLLDLRSTAKNALIRIERSN